MNQIISISVVIRLSLISFIQLCSVFTRDNAFSQRHWNRDNTSVYYTSLAKSSIIISFVFYEYFLDQGEHSFLCLCDFEYTEDGVHYDRLLSVRTEKQHPTDRTCIRLMNKKQREQIYYLNNIRTNDFIIWPVGNIDFNVEVNVENWQSIQPTKSFELTLKWNNPKKCKNIKYIRLRGKWVFSDDTKYDRLVEVYEPFVLKSNSNSLQNAPSVLTSEINNNVKVTGEADSISIIGAKPGEYIKVYTTTGAEVKSVVANDDVVNIKLEKNQIYIVKTGLARYKVTL